MPVRVLTAHPRVDAVRGCAALARGPLVYCLEQADQPDGVAVEDIRLDPASPPDAAGPNAALGVPVTLVGAAAVVDSQPRARLYSELGQEKELPAAATTLTAIPYFRWANRELGAMRVWIPTT